jgi:hypothetical protein
MRKLALLILAVGAVAVLSVPSAHAQAKCGNDICIGSSGTQVHAKGNLILDRPILSGTSGNVIIDAGVTIVGSTVVTGTASVGTSKPDLLDAGSGMINGNLQIAGKVPVLRADIVDAGILFIQGTGPIYRMVPFTTAATDLASTTTTCTDSAGTTATGARTGDVCTLGMPSTLTGAGTGLNGNYTCYVSAADTVKVRHCAAGTADDPGSVVYTGVVISTTP